MAFFDFLKFRKKKNKLDRAAERKFDKDGVQPLSVDPADIDPPETRYTPEYAEFIKAQEEAAKRHENESEQ